MNRFKVRDLMLLTDEQLQQLPEAYEVEFEDGVVDTVFKYETRYSVLFWGVFNHYPGAKIRAQHHLHAVLAGTELDAKTHQKLVTNIIKSIREDMRLDLPEQREPLMEIMMKTITDAQNALVLMTEEDVISLDILDFVQITRHPKITELKQSAMDNPELIKRVYKEAYNEILTNPDFDNNGLAKACRARMVKEGQVLQCVLFRGFPSEVDGTIFNEAVWSNYTSGNTGLYELASDSRTAAKSHFYSDSALKDSEYNARKFQLFTMPLERIIYQDCGTPKLTPWRVKGPVIDDNGVMQYNGDLNKLIGKYYKTNPADTELKIITGDEKHLIGETIWMRTVLTCTHKNPHEVCHICAGKLSENISRFDNVGHIGTITVVNVLSQTILSFKHVNTSSTMCHIKLDEFQRRYLNTGVTGAGYYITKPSKKIQTVFLSVPRDEASGLQDLADTHILEYLTLSRISQIKAIKLGYVDNHGHIEEITLPVETKQGDSMLSRELLSYLQKVGWSVDAANNFQFDMRTWDYDQPILVIENKEESVVELVSQVEIMVQSNKTLHKKRLVVEDAPSILLQDLFDLVNSRFNINILCFEIIVYGLMTYAEDSYALGRNAKTPVLGIANELMLHRTLGVAMCYQAHEQSLLNPGYYFQGTRPDSPMDVFLKPNEVINRYYGPQS